MKIEYLQEEPVKRAFRLDEVYTFGTSLFYVVGVPPASSPVAFVGDEWDMENKIYVAGTQVFKESIAAKNMKRVTKLTVHTE